MTAPTTPIIDNFNRANEGPPLAGGWLFDPDLTGLKVVSDQLATTSTGNYTGRKEFWATAAGPDCDAYIDMATDYSGDSGGIGFRLFARVPIGSYLASTSVDGYIFWMKGFHLQLLVSSSGSETLLDSYDHFTDFVAGDGFWLNCEGTTISVYYRTGGVWTLAMQATDSTYSVAGYIGVQIRDYLIQLDNFGGGTITSVPVADFSGTPLAGGKPLSVAFTDASTGPPVSWLWYFGDGNTSTAQNPTHVYTADGVYTVALTATNIDGSDTETKVGYVTVASPVADFSGTPTSGTVALSVDFTDLSTNVPTAWFWDFGDGGSSTDQDPTYVYNYIGTYTVTLTASNGSGSDSEVKVAYITVTAVVEYGAAVIENCDIDTGGLAVGLRVADVAIARDNRLASITVDASAELRAKDNSYTTLVNNGTLQPLAGDRSVFDAIGYAARHTNDADDSATAIHHTLGTGADQAAAGDHAHAGMGTVTNIATGTGLTGGPITTTGTISDANTGVAAATYGDASNIPQIAVNAQGRITSAANIAISTFTPINVYNETQTADGISLTYYLANYAAESTIRVYIDGIRQPTSDDSAATDVVIFDVAPDAGALLLFDYEMDTA